MKHILLKLYLVFFLFILSNKIFCQDSSTIIQVDMDNNDKFFVNAGTIPHSQKIVLIGTSGNTVFTKVQVESATTNGKQTYDAIINDTDWKVTIGPFQPRQLLTLTIKATKILEANDRKLSETLEEALKKTTNDISADLEKTSVGLNIETLKNNFLRYTKTNLGSQLNNYYLDNDKKVADNLGVVFSNIDYLSLLTNFSNIQNSYKYKKQAEADADSVKIQSEITNINSIKNSVENGIKKIISQIKFQQISTVIPLSSVELKASGVEYYAGFDVSAITFDKNLGATGLYFTISPYVFGRFDPELDFSDVRIPKNSNMSSKQKDIINRKNVALWLKYHISPTVGVSFAGNTNVPNTPQLFAGMSFRLNRLFKITTGSVFYRNPQNENYIHNFSVGMSLSLNYFGTVLQMVGNATRAVNPN